MFVLRVTIDDMLFLEDIFDYYFRDRDHYDVKYQDLSHKLLSAEFYDDDVFHIVLKDIVKEEDPE